MGKLVHFPQSIWKFGMPSVLLCCTLFSCSVVSNSCLAPLSMEFPREEYGSGLPCPPPRDLPNPGIKPRSPTMQADSYQLSHNGSPSMLAWVVYPFSKWSSQPGNWTGVSWLQGDSLPAELPGNPLVLLIMSNLTYFNCE